MTVNRGLWVPINTGNVGTTEVEARLADAALFESNNGADPRSGLLGQGAATVVTGRADMSYDIAACSPVINRAAGEGVYRFSATGVTNIATTAAPAANSRIDIIWLKQNDQSKTDANNLAVAGVTQGAVAASPVAPAIPAGALELARATVGPNITGTNAAAITQTFRYTAFKGQPIPVRNTTERAEITAPRIGQLVARLDLDANGRIQERRTAAGWLAETAHAEFTSASNVVPTNAEWGMGTFTRDTAAGVGYESAAGTDNAWISISAVDTLTVRDAGLYDITVTPSFDANITGVVWASVNPGYILPLIPGIAVGTVNVSNVRLAAGATIRPSVVHNSGANRTMTSRVRVTRKG